MGRYHGILALLAATVLGVNGGPCKPKSHHPHRPHHPHSSSSTVTLATTTTSGTCEGYSCEPGLSFSSSTTTTVHVSETTLAPETTTSTTIEPSVTQSTSDSTSVSPSESNTESTSESTTTSTTESVSESTTAASSTITSSSTVAGPPPCVETQLLVNGGFDDNNDGSPWILGSGVAISQVNPRSSPNFLYNTMNPALKTTTFSQTLPALGAFTYQLDYYINLQTAINGRGFSCSATPSINSQVLQSSVTLTDSGPYGFRLSSQIFNADDQDAPATISISITCSGTFNVIIIGADDVSLTRLCAI